IDIIGNGDLIKEFDIDLYFKMIEKMVVIDGDKIVVSFLDGTDVECAIE
ncbi:MAG: recombinase family protein, partial [Tissierellia bacterium]|nr:recombinase family protein [Tissierellia bacterium]